MIAEAAEPWTRWVSVIVMSVSRPAAWRASAELLAGEGSGDAAGEGGHVGAGGVVHVGVGDHVGDGEASAGLEHACGFTEDPGFVAGEVDDAVGDDHADRVRGQGDLLDGAAEPLHVGDAGFGLVPASEVEHLVGHVESVGQTRRADTASGEKHVDPSTGTEVEHCLTRVELGDRGGVATAERGENCGAGELVAVLGAVEAGAEEVALLGGDDLGVGVTAARARGAVTPLSGAGRRGGVALAHDVTQLMGVGGDAHERSSLH